MNLLYKQYALISGATFLCGLILCAMHYEWIVFCNPLQTTHQNALGNTIKKEVHLFFWLHNKWQKENHTILWANETAQNITLLLTALLNVLDDEQLLHKKIRIESVALSPSGHQAYISFDRNPINKNAAIYDKWHLIESILKTMRENKIEIQDVHFLVYHEPLNDPHLDFNQPWPLRGFLEQ